MKKCMLLPGLLAGSLLLSGCLTTNAKITPDDTAKYQSPRAFMEDQLDQRILPIDKKAVLSDGTIVYTAYFNEVNARYLRKPEEDAQGYCETKKGKWHFLHPIDFSNNTLVTSRNNGLAYLESKKDSGADPEAVRQAQAMTIQQYQIDRQVLAIPQVNRAAKNGYLGEFACESPLGNWQITIRPMHLENTKSTGDHALTVYVSVNEQ